MKSNVWLFILLIFNINLYSQDGKDRLFKEYLKGICHYLAPDTADYTREILFISMPEDGTSQYSLALESQKGISRLKVRSFINIYSSFLPQADSNKKNATYKLTSIEKEVSNAFANKLKLFYQFVLVTDPEEELSGKINFDIDDSKQYYLVNKNYKRRFSESDFHRSKNYSELIKVCENITRDLRNGIFNDTKYIGLIDALGARGSSDPCSLPPIPPRR